MPPKKKTTEVSAWKKQAQGVDLPLPSGNVCLVRPVGMQVFMQKGMIPNSLMPIVNKAMQDQKPMEMKDLGEMDEQKLSDVMELVDAVTCFVVTEPVVSSVATREAIERDETLTPEEREEKLNSTLFVDEVDLDDKMFIFQFSVGGTRDVERFREQQAALVEPLPGQPDVPVPTE